MITNVIKPSEGKNKYIFFSGKGGVGKTTVSAATAVWLANQGYKTLIISTDLQLSLNDVFNQEITSQGTKITGVPNLTAISIDAAESMEKYRQRTIEMLRILEPNSIILQQMELDKKVECGSAQAAVYELTEYFNDNQYDVIVFDNAPTGAHLEKILAQSQYVLSLVNQIEKKKKLVELYGDPEVKKQVPALEKLVEKDKNAIEKLRSELTSFIMVMTAEPLPLAELTRNIPILENDYHIYVKGIIINNVLSQAERKSTSFWKERWNMQEKYINSAYQQFNNKEIEKSWLIDEEVIGVEKLKLVGERIYGGNNNA